MDNVLKKLQHRQVDYKQVRRLKIHLIFLLNMDKVRLDDVVVITNDIFRDLMLMNH